jgi:release factor glutamine methyltransferase
MNSSTHHPQKASGPTLLEPTLQQAVARGLARIDAQMLMLHALERSVHDRAWLAMHSADLLGAEAAQRFEAMVQRRLHQEPVAYITGENEFFGLNLRVDARVLDPRPDTEILVEWALQVIEPGQPLKVADLGTGSGAIALAIKSQRPAVQMTAVDVSPEALDVARLNAQRLNLEVNFRHGTWLTGVSDTFDVIVSNPPYIAAGDPHLSQLHHEPLNALASGLDGLKDLRQIIEQAFARLQPGGWLLLEHGHDQAPAVSVLLQKAGFVQVQSRPDLAGIARCSGGQRPKLT